MISAVFVERPRLAIVIAFVITLAGALALLQIPVAQFPDIVPPQVTVSGVFPGASAEVVETSVAQPLEAQVVGVDRALYMKSTSGNDGSYTLTVSFALGTDPDINTVNVNNRVQTALSQLPPEVQQQGLVVQKKSSAILQFIVLYSANGEQDPSGVLGVRYLSSTNIFPLLELCKAISEGFSLFYHSRTLLFLSAIKN